MIKIWGYNGSTAEAYANEYGFPFRSLDMAGSCGKNDSDAVNWKLTKNGKTRSGETTYSLTISGKGNMDEYGAWSFLVSAPWADYIVTDIQVQSGVTGIGGNAFWSAGWDAGEPLPVTVSIADTVKYIGFQAFGNSNLADITIPASVNTIDSGAFYPGSLNSITILNRNCSIGNGSYDGYTLGDPETTVIKGYKGSTAESYAKATGHKFVALDATLAAPKLSGVSNTATGVKITWGKVTGAAKYRVFYKTGSGGWKKLADTTATSYTWTKAKSGTKYSFTVRCLSKDGKSYTSTYNKTGLTKTFIGQVKNVKVSNKPTGVKITWSKVGGAAKYRVYYKTGSGDWKKLKDTTATSYTWTKAKSGTKYTFAVQVITKDGKSTYNSKSASVTKTFIGQVKNVKVSNKPTGVKIAWGKVTGAAKYRVYYKTGSGDWKKLKDTTSTSYTWTKAKSGTKYTFAVQVITKDGKNTYNSKSASIGKKYIAQVKLSKVSNVATGVKIAWGKVTGAAKYRVYYKTGSGDWKKLKDTTATSYTWTKAKSGTKYTFAVQVISKDGKTTYNSKSASKSITYVASR